MHLGVKVWHVTVLALVLISTGMVSHDAFAMGDAPSTCTNRYDGTITSFVISNGTGTYDAVANPGVTFDVGMHGTYSVSFVIHMANSSTFGNTDPGTTWYDDNAFGYQDGHCVPSRNAVVFAPNQDVSVNATFGHPANFSPFQEEIQNAVFNTFLNDISYNVDWKLDSASSSSSVPSEPQNLQANGGKMQVILSWSAPSSSGGSPVTGYNVYRGTTSGSESLLTGVGNATSYADSNVTGGQAYYYMVTAVNSAGESIKSNEASATPFAPRGIVLDMVRSTLGSGANLVVIQDFGSGTGTDRLLVVGIGANNNDVSSVTFGDRHLARAAYSFYNNDAEFWYLKNPSGTGNITVTMNGPTSASVGAYEFSGVNQTAPIATHAQRHNSAPGSPVISINAKYQNDWVLDLPSIYGGSVLNYPTCEKHWENTVSDEITGASSSSVVPAPGVVTCRWTASQDDLWDDVAVELRALG